MPPTAAKPEPQTLADADRQAVPPAEWSHDRTLCQAWITACARCRAKLTASELDLIRDTRIRIISDIADRYGVEPKIAAFAVAGILADVLDETREGA